MRLVHILGMVLIQLSVGSLVMLSLLSPREIRISFFTFSSFLAAVLAAFALFAELSGPATMPEILPVLGPIILAAALAGGAFRLEKFGLAQSLVILAAAWGMVLAVWPIMSRALATRAIEAGSPWMLSIGGILGALLLGAVHIAMVLGHWYLVMRQLSFEHLRRMNLILLGVLVARAIWFGATLWGLERTDPWLAAYVLSSLWSVSGQLFFTLMRLLWGIALPVVLALMSLRCIAVRHNQAATGLLYLCEVSVLFGELFAAYLLL